LLVWVVIVLVIGPAWCGAQAPTLTVTGLDGRTSSGELLQVVPEIIVRTSEGPASIPWSEVLNVEVGGEGPQSRPATSAAPLWFELADGSSFPGEVSAADEGGFLVRWGERTCRLDTSMIRLIRAMVAPPAAEARFREALSEARQRSGDNGADRPAALDDLAVVARDEDVLALRGRVQQIEPNAVRFEWNGRVVHLPWARVAGLLFARPSPRSASCIVRLHSGEAFAGRVVGGGADGLVLRSAMFEDLPLTWVAIAGVDCRSERLVFLSELTPARYEFEPLFDKRWEFAADRTLSGRRIRLGGQTYARGLTLHSGARLTYRLGGQFAQFAALAGIADEMSQRGCATLRVVGDGQVLWEATGVRGGQPPREVVVSVSGVDELTLIVEYGEELDLSDEVVWALARVIR
jgi:hypothetical protein